MKFIIKKLLLTMVLVAGFVLAGCNAVNQVASTVGVTGKSDKAMQYVSAVISFTNEYSAKVADSASDLTDVSEDMGKEIIYKTFIGKVAVNETMDFKKDIEIAQNPGGYLEADEAKLFEGQIVSFFKLRDEYNIKLDAIEKNIKSEDYKNDGKKQLQSMLTEAISMNQKLAEQVRALADNSDQLRNKYFKEVVSKEPFGKYMLEMDDILTQAEIYQKIEKDSCNNIAEFEQKYAGLEKINENYKQNKAAIQEDVKKESSGDASTAVSYPHYYESFYGNLDTGFLASFKKFINKCKSGELKTEEDYYASADEMLTQYNTLVDSYNYFSN